MKINIKLSAAAIMLSAVTHAQVAIGKSELSKIQPTQTTNPSISLEFYDGTNNAKGLVLPWTSTVPNQPVTYNAATGAGYKGMAGTIVPGTLIFDLSDKNIKYQNNVTWINLTNINFPVNTTIDGISTVISSNSAVDSSLQDNLKEATNAKVAIGANANTDSTTGIFILTDPDRAMILPKVASPHLNIINPTPGTIVFDTVKQQLALYNGTVWTFLKPS